jgi:tetratricopeptide (TPR) repeat protein
MNTLRATTVALIVVAHLSPALARADEADPDVLIMRGLNLRRAGRSAEALALFRRAYEVAPSPRTLGQMGLVESSLQLWAEAEAHLCAALATPDDAWVHRNRQFLDQARGRTREHMGELVITGPPGTKVSLGEKAIGRLPLAAPVRLVEGEITIDATSDGYKPFSLDLSIKGGARAAVSIVLERIDLAARNPEVQNLVPTAPPTRHWRLWTGTALAVAGAAALTWGITWMALEDRPVCGGGPPAACPTTYDTRTPGILLAAGGGALALAGGALLYSGLHPTALNVTLGLTTHSLRFEARF